MSQPALDFSFKCIKSLLDETKEKPRIKLKPLEICKETGKVKTRSLKLHNNLLTSLNGLREFVEKWIADPDELAWLDVSFNFLPEIEQVLTQFPKLRILYFHGNRIQSFRDIRQVMLMPQLRTLTLHGNPLDTESNYRRKVIALVWQLRSLDFNDVTKQERENALPFTRRRTT